MTERKNHVRECKMKSNKAEWIWYFGDYELVQLNHCLTSRYEGDVFIPPFWRMDSPYANVKFVKEFSLSTPEEISVYANGKFNVIIDRIEAPANIPLRNFCGKVLLGAGNYRMTVSVYNESGLPALFVDGKTLKSDETFLVTCNDFGYVHAGCAGLTDPLSPPSYFRFCLEEISYEVLERGKGSMLVDCGAEMMAKLRFNGASSGTVHIYYGESEIEARAKGECELTDTLDLALHTETLIAKACRYILLECDSEEALGRLKIFREYNPTRSRSAFRCSDERVDRIYSVARDTLALNTREFYLDGLKRDRWVWAGDAYQCYLMSYYSFFDRKTVERTMIALAGKKPVSTFINHIMDYSFLWIISLWDYYQYIGDVRFLERMLPIAEAHIQFAMTRRNADGLLEGDPCDWVFLDWAHLDNRGEVAAEQILFWKSLDVMGKLCELFHRDGKKYFAYRDEVKEALFRLLWDKERGVFYHTRIDGKPHPEIKKHAHIFALLFGLLEGEQIKAAERVLTSADIEAIVTPYMRLYELEALCKIGERDYVLNEIRSYWGGMLDEGATSFWEFYDPAEKGNEKYAMYGRPFGKSLCHAWGAGPLYLLGRYFAGLEPAEPGYATFRMKPYMGDLDWLECTLPAGDGKVEISLTRDHVRVYSDKKSGTLLLDGKCFALSGGYDRMEDGCYVFDIAAGNVREAGLKRLGGKEE